MLILAVIVKAPDPKCEEWAKKWIQSVATGVSTMSGRRLSSIDKWGGGLKKVARIARQHKVHLVLLEDDEGRKVVAASTKPFKVIA